MYETHLTFIWHFAHSDLIKLSLHFWLPFPVFVQEGLSIIQLLPYPRLTPPVYSKRAKEVGEGYFFWLVGKELKERSVFFWHIRCWLRWEAGYRPGWANKLAENGISYISASKSLFKAYFAYDGSTDHIRVIGNSYLWKFLSATVAPCLREPRMEYDRLIYMLPWGFRRPYWHELSTLKK